MSHGEGAGTQIPHSMLSEMSRARQQKHETTKKQEHVASLDKSEQQELLVKQPDNRFNRKRHQNSP